MARSYTLSPSQAWHELGRAPLGSRGRLRLTRAVSELQFIDHALTECSRERGPKDAPPDVAEVLAAKEVSGLYAADQGFDTYGDFEDDDTADDDAATEPTEDVLT